VHSPIVNFSLRLGRQSDQDTAIGAKLDPRSAALPRQRITDRCRPTTHPRHPMSTGYCWEKAAPALRVVAPHAKPEKPTATATRLGWAMSSDPALEQRDSAALVGPSAEE